jgi:hypothetical protein
LKKLGSISTISAKALTATLVFKAETEKQLVGLFDHVHRRFFDLTIPHQTLDHHHRHHQPHSRFTPHATSVLIFHLREKFAPLNLND